MSEVKNTQAQQKECAMIPLYASEKQTHRLYGIIRMLVIVIIIMFLAFAGYVFYQSQFEVIRIEQEATSDGQTLVNGTGELNYYGNESETDDSHAP